MSYELRSYINQIHKIPDELLELFLGSWHQKSFSKKEIVTRAEEIEPYLYFSTGGVQKAYYLKNDKEYIIAFTYPFAFTCIPESFLTQEPSKYFFECITDSEFLRIPYNHFSDFVERHHEVETLLRKTLIGTLNGVVNRYHRLLTMPMEERFLDFMRTNPKLINQIPHKSIANYLRMDPTNFSKLLNSTRI
jgi:CRP-like cAMP-binding protein